MKLAFLSGAYKNAGDFLIESKAIELLKYALPNAQIIRYLRKDIADYIDEINSCNAVIFGGGPIYMHSIDGYLPLDVCIEKIHSPIMILGGGWYGANGGLNLTYNYSFDKKTLKFYQKIDSNGFGLSCRDLYTFRTLKKENLKKVFMTGCPAWYDVECLDKVFNEKPWDEIKAITISDPAKSVNYYNAIKVISYVQKKFPNANIEFVFHRGVSSDSYTSSKSGKRLDDFYNAVKETGVKIRDISYSADGFSVYDNSDLHIGFRVHAHIYSLSKRKRTVLIEEDGRGAGVNQALGLPSIKSYSDDIQIENSTWQKIHKRLPGYVYKYLIEDIDSYFNVLESTNDQYLINAYELQKKYFNNMVSFIKQIK